MKNWILAARPKTLLAGVVPVWVGCDLAYGVGGVFDGWLAACTVASALCIQVATNFFNDAIDFQKGADGEGRLGPQRVTASGLLSARQVMALSIVVLVLACVFAVPLIAARGWPILLIGIPSLYLSYGYTGGPVPLAYRGLGELFVIVFFGLVAVMGTYFVQTGEWVMEAAVAGLQVGMFSTVLIAVNNLRDIEEDRASGKRTLAVRWGEGWARAEIVALCVLPHVLGFFWWQAGTGAAWVIPILGLCVPAALIILGVTRTPISSGQASAGPRYNVFLAMSALQLLLYAIFFSMGLRHG